jgi:hypothetical protein
MNTAMQFEEQVSAFIDGALGAEAETEFLHILSVSPEKRALLHEYLSLKSMIAADARAITVPPALDAAVLGAAGLGLAGGIAAGGAAAGAGAAIGGAAIVGGGTAGGAATVGGTVAASGTLVTGAAASGGAMAAAVATAGWWTARRMLGALLLGLSLFTGGYMLNDAMQDGGTENTAAKQNNFSAPAETPQSTSLQDVAEQEGAEQGGSKSEGAGGPVVKYRTIIVNRIDTVYLAPALASTPARTDTVLHFRVDTQYVAIAQRSLHERPITITEAPPMPLQLLQPGRIDVEVQREHLSTWPYIDYQRAGVEREQQHFSVLAGYAFDVNHAVGLMFGEKSFAMEYYRIDNDSLYIYQRQPALLFGGGFYRFSLPLTTGITPEVMLQVGGTDLGPILGAASPFDFRRSGS